MSMAEIQADKDQLRAEFAMSTRRLEMSVEQMKAKTTSQLAEIGKKSEAIGPPAGSSFGDKDRGAVCARGQGEQLVEELRKRRARSLPRAPTDAGARPEQALGATRQIGRAHRQARRQLATPPTASGSELVALRAQVERAAAPDRGLRDGGQGTSMPTARHRVRRGEASSHARSPREHARAEVLGNRVRRARAPSAGPDH